MIENFEQPKKIVISDTLELIRYYPYYRRTLPWYQDLTLCKQVDNIDHPYDLARLKRMYTYLSKKGECYYIKAAPHNGARRFGERFWHKRKYEKCGNTGCISHFSYCTIGAKDPPKPAVPIVRCCLKYKDGHAWHLVGDISLCNGAVSIVIAPEFQNRHIGRAAITGICRRAKEIGLSHLDAEIYAFNAQSRRAFEAAGFREISSEQFRILL